MPKTPQFERDFEQNWPVDDWTHVHVAVAVSGGADSVAMLRAMVANRFTFADAPIGRLIVVHVNHRLREDALDDAQFVEQLAQELGCQFVVREVDTTKLARSAGDGIESAARQLRYDALASVARETGSRYIATAHTADDQAETVLHRIVRGTSVSGLSGIPRTRPLDDSVTLIRPLLPFRRHEIEAYLSEVGQSYRTDETNTDSAFTRNRIRHELIPQLEASFNPAVVEALLRLRESAAEAAAACNQIVAQLAASAIIESRTDRIVIDCAALADVAAYFRSRLIVDQWSRWNWPRQGMTREHWCVLVELTEIGSESRSVDLPGGVIACRKDAGHLVLTRRR